ncbi:MAG TPA: hypothetical protein VF897_22550 [Roseiflexaceae bacterium]
MSAMIDCNDVRETLALQSLIEDAALEEHLDTCAACAKYRRQHQALDLVLRAEMHWDAPAALTARLLALTGAPELVLPGSAPVARTPRAQAAPARPQPKGWYVTLVYALTLAVVGLSLLVAWQFVGSLTPQVELGAALTQLLALPGQGLRYLTEALPQSRIAIDMFLRLRTQLMWLLLVVVLWAALDKWNPQFTFMGRQISL